MTGMSFISAGPKLNMFKYSTVQNWKQLLFMTDSGSRDEKCVMNSICGLEVKGHMGQGQESHLSRSN